MSPVAHPDSCSLEIKGLGTCFGWANFGDLAGLNWPLLPTCPGGLMVLQQVHFWGRDFVFALSMLNSVSTIS